VWAAEWGVGGPDSIEADAAAVPWPRDDGGMGWQYSNRARRGGSRRGCHRNDADSRRIGSCAWHVWCWELPHDAAATDGSSCHEIWWCWQLSDVYMVCLWICFRCTVRVGAICAWCRRGDRCVMPWVFVDPTLFDLFKQVCPGYTLLGDLVACRYCPPDLCVHTPDFLTGTILCSRWLVN
jgi:hypothetical protein